MRLLVIALPLLSLACSRRPAPPSEELPLVPRVDPRARRRPRQRRADPRRRPARAAPRHPRQRTTEDRDKALRAAGPAELLAQEAAKRGLARHPTVRDVQRRALAETFVRRRFQLTPKEIPREHVERAYQLNRLRYRRPESVNVTHIVVLANARSTPTSTIAPCGRRGGSTASPRPAGCRRRRSGRSPSWCEDAPALTIKAESLTTPLRGLTVPSSRTLPSRSASAARSALSSGPVRLPRHLLQRALPRATCRWRSEEEIRGKIFEEVRQAMFLKWLGELERRHTITTSPDVVARIASPDGWARDDGERLRADLETRDVGARRAGRDLRRLEGEAVDEFATPAEADIRITGAQWGVAYYLARDLCAKHALGMPSEVVLRFQQSSR